MIPDAMQTGCGAPSPHCGQHTSTIENGLVYLPEKAEWLAEYMHEMTLFPFGKYDDQADSTSQALDWVRGRHPVYGFVEYIKQEQAKQGMSPSASRAFMLRNQRF